MSDVLTLREAADALDTNERALRRALATAGLPIGSFEGREGITRATFAALQRSLADATFDEAEDAERRALDQYGADLPRRMLEDPAGGLGTSPSG